jgi:methylthioribulose-1-phosphate dehydratase
LKNAQLHNNRPAVTDATDRLRAIGREFHQRGWSLGTSSNYSVVLSRDPLRLLITASGKDKGQLTQDDFVIVDEQGALLETTGSGKPSAETLLHVVIASARRDVGAVLHTHSVWATCLSDWHHERGMLSIGGYEMLKGLEGIKTHDHTQHFRIFQNTQDIGALSHELGKLLEAHDSTLQFAFLLRRHGLYTWGRDLAEARRHVEILEFLFEVVGRTQTLGVQAR